MLSTVDDLLKFAHILMYSFQWKDGLPAGYLKPQTLQNMWSLVDKTKKNQYAEGGYGWGWMVCFGASHALSEVRVLPYRLSPFAGLAWQCTAC